MSKRKAKPISTADAVKRIADAVNNRRGVSDEAVLGLIKTILAQTEG